MPIEGGLGYHPPSYWVVILGHRIGFSIESRVILTGEGGVSEERGRVGGKLGEVNEI